MDHGKVEVEVIKIPHGLLLLLLKIGRLFLKILLYILKLWIISINFITY
jgi:hypothetical protein